MPYDLSCIQIFRAVTKTGTAPNIVVTEDTTATYAMIDAAVVAKVKVGLSAAQITVVDSYVYVPLMSDFTDRGFPSWAGNDPPAIYFKIIGTLLQQDSRLQAALVKFWRAA